MVPQLILIDGSVIKKSERIEAAQNYDFWLKKLRSDALDNIAKKEVDPDRLNPNKYSKESRRKMYLEMEEDRLKQEKEKEEKKQESPWNGEEKPKVAEVYYKDGNLRQCNQGKYRWTLDEDTFKSGMTTFTLHLPKFMDTSQVTCDVNPTYIRVTANEKVTQIKLENEIISSEAEVQRSQTTGFLVVKAPMVKFKGKDKVFDFVVTRTKKEEKKYMVNEIEVVKETKAEKENKRKEVVIPDDVDLTEVPDLE